MFLFFLRTDVEELLFIIARGMGGMLEIYCAACRSRHRPGSFLMTEDAKLQMLSLLRQRQIPGFKSWQK